MLEIKKGVLLGGVSFIHCFLKQLEMEQGPDADTGAMELHQLNI